MNTLPVKHFCSAVLLFLLLLVSGCAPGAGIPDLPPDLQTQFPPPTPTLLSVLQTATFEASQTQNAPTPVLPTATLQPTLPPTPTPGPYARLTILDLASRSYGGDFSIDQEMGREAGFTRSLFRYTSDGLDQFGFMNVPDGEGPFPVVIVIHGYLDPAQYKVLDYTTRYADALARAGYLVLHPTLRGYPPSQDGPNLFRVGFAVDVLNLTAIVRQQDGQPGALEKADPQRIGLLGHSMGGGISIRSMVVDPGIRAVVLYGAMSADEKLNIDRIYNVFSNHQRALPEQDVPTEAVQEISPVNYLDRVAAAVSIHHGELDDQVPPQWSADLCSQLTVLNKRVECFTYPGAGHTFTGETDRQFIERVVSFYDRELKP